VAHLFTYLHNNVTNKMDLAKVCSKALVVAKPKGSLGPEKKKVNVLDEESYTEVRMLCSYSVYTQQLN